MNFLLRNRVWILWFTVVTVCLLSVWILLTWNRGIEVRPKKLFQYAVPTIIQQQDCDQTMVPCKTDTQCNVCLSNAKCVDGVCKPVESSLPNDCDLSKGLLGILEYNQVTARYERTCLPTDPGIVKPDGTNVFCNNGTADSVDYLKQAPQECACPDGTIKVPVYGNSVIRTRYECAPKEKWSLLDNRYNTINF